MKNKKIFLIFAIVFFFLSLIFLRHHFSIFYFQNDINSIALNVEANAPCGDLYACFNTNCDKMEYDKGVYSYRLNQSNPLFYKEKINTIELISKSKDVFKNIDSISVFYGNDFSYITPFDIEQEKIEFQNEISYSIALPIKAHDKTLLQKFAVYFESLFYNWYFYIFTYIFLFFYLKDKSFLNKINFKKISPIFLILLLGFLLRLSHIDFIPLWNDELYTLCCVFHNEFDIKRTIMDPGNPPLFYLFSNLWLLKFNSSVSSIRFLALIIGLIQIYSIYFILNKILNKKTALIAAFLSAVNIFIILESNEIRSYILAMTLVLWGGYYFYKLNREFSFKCALIYCLISICLINTHYYAFLYVFSNFLIGIFTLKNNRFKFLLLNFAAFLSFIPYFQTTVINQSFCSNFNTWLEKPDLTVLYNHIVFYFGNLIFFILILCFTFYALKKYLKNSFESKVVLYNIFSIAIVFICAYLISVLIKPILFERYFCIFLPLLIVNTAIFLLIPYKIKYLAVFILFFSINAPKYENFNLFSNIYFMAMYSSADYKNQKAEPFFVIPDTIEYTKYYPKIPSDRVIVSNFGVREDKNLEAEYLKEIKKKALKSNKIVLYLPEICINSKIKYSKNPNIKKIETTILPVYKIFLDL